MPRGATSRGLARRLNEWLVARTLLPFLLYPSKGGSKGNHAYDGRQIAGATSQRDDKALVQFHYDLSNTFCTLFLDPEMQYSCAYFPSAAADLAAAQQAKLDMICRKLRLQPGDRFLDIGCGWGGLICHAARKYNVQAHGVTLSEAQHEHAREKIERSGLQGRMTVELKDYRALSGE